MTGSLLLHGISSLVTNDPEAGPGMLGLVPEAAVIIDEEKIAWVGPANLAPEADDDVDLGGRAVLPGWVDSHTHLVFAGDRAAEFTARMAGRPYEAAASPSPSRRPARHPTKSCWPGRCGASR